ncbi:hypothetical protein DFQ27_000029 [Actinomortierella ambigua]|uniref:Uncharacterized protein n=1 Tax=Actinomortierella ambigua TaxID=1343610 RepID=A0A9P6QNI7_9FUNG|nr:hypothetical protein DFQ27_000029 [Actinomortierella ambigua]
MDTDYKDFCDNTAVGKINILEFMRRFSFLHDKKKILGREHARTMLPQVIQQHQALGVLNTTLTEQFAASEVERITQTEIGTDASSSRSGKSAKKSKRSLGVDSSDKEGDKSVDDKGVKHDGTNEKRKKSRRTSIPSPWSAVPVSPKPIHDTGRTSSLSAGGDDPLPTPYVDISSFTVYQYQVGDCNVGELFKKFQEDSATIVNNSDITASLANIPKFLAMNYIFTTFARLPGLPQNVLQDIQKTHTWPVAQLDSRILHLCADLDQQLAMGEQVQAEAGSPDERKILVLYQMLELKLPVHHNMFSNGLEDTYCHQVIDALVSSQFPARSSTYSLDWANGEAHGSRKRRGHGYRPDACILKYGRQIAFLEIKPPGDGHTAKEYLWDYWNLANYTKDAIDLFLQEGHPIVRAAAVQLFSK